MRRHFPAAAAARLCGLIAALAIASSPPARAEMTLRRLYVNPPFMTPPHPPGRSVSRIQFVFVLVRDGPVELLVMDSRGRRVRTLIDEVLSTGRHEVWWNGKRDNGTVAPPGIYRAVFSLAAEGVREVNPIFCLDNDSPLVRRHFPRR